MPVVPLQTVSGALDGTILGSRDLSAGSAFVQIRPQAATAWIDVGDYSVDGIQLGFSNELGSYEDNRGRMAEWIKKVRGSIKFTHSKMGPEVLLALYRWLFEQVSDAADVSRIGGIAIVDRTGQMLSEFEFRLRLIQYVNNEASDDSWMQCELYRVYLKSGYSLTLSTDVKKTEIELEVLSSDMHKSPAGLPMFGLVGRPNFRPIVKVRLDEVTLTPTIGTIAFGGPHSTPQERPLEIFNDGSALMTVNAITVSGLDATEFTVLDGAGAPLPVAPPIATIAPGASWPFRLRYSPTAAGAVSATLTIGSNADNPAFAVNITATGV